jgi:hypothetical protein
LMAETIWSLVRCRGISFPANVEALSHLLEGEASTTG